MRRFGRRFAIAMATVFMGFALLAAPSVQAVQLDPGGLGQVLIYPYYTVHDRQQTVFSITNTSDFEQVVQVTLREALNGRPALQFKVWLGRYDVWSGTLFALADDGVATDGVGMVTLDRSCTTPTFTSSGLTNSGGIPYLPLLNDGYSGAMSDGGPSGLARARHGWIEVIALANLTGALASAITHTGSGNPANCAVVQNTGLSTFITAPPTGGLTGNVTVTRARSGTWLSSRAEALSGFTETSLFSESPAPAPDLASVNESGAGGAVVAKTIDDKGRMQVLTYGAPASGSRPIDAVSAVLMATRVKNDYQTNPFLSAATDWVLTLPTQRFYTDPAIIGATSPVLAPFDEVFKSPGAARVCALFRIFDQNQRTLSQQPGSNACTLGPIGIQGFNVRQFIVLFQAANAIAFYEPYSSPLQTAVLAAPKPPGLPLADSGGHFRPAVGPAGWLNMTLTSTNFTHRMPASAEGKILSGLPVIGYSAMAIGNSSSIGSVLTTKAASRNANVVRHATSVSCTKASDGLPCD